MDNRKWESGASVNPPAAPAAPSAGYPTDGDALASVPPTIPGAYWFYQIGEELRAILTAAGIAPDKAVLTQLLTALRSAGVFQTPAQFDNSTKVCTTAFAKSMGKSFGGILSIAANSVLDAASAGKLVTVAGNGLTITLPSAAAFPAGTAITFLGFGWVSSSTIQRAGADAIYPNGVGGGINLFALNYGDNITLVSNGANTWYVADGNAMQGLYSQSFRASLTGIGYQKLPSGLIMQWGFGQASAGTLTVALPITFPITNLMAVASSYGGATTMLATVNAMSTSQITIAAVTSTTGVAASGQVAWLAFGY